MSIAILLNIYVYILIKDRNQRSIFVMNYLYALKYFGNRKIYGTSSNERNMVRKKGVRLQKKENKQKKRVTSIAVMPESPTLFIALDFILSSDEEGCASSAAAGAPALLLPSLDTGGSGGSTISAILRGLAGGKGGGNTAGSIGITIPPTLVADIVYAWGLDSLK